MKKLLAILALAAAATQASAATITMTGECTGLACSAVLGIGDTSSGLFVVVMDTTDVDGTLDLTSPVTTNVYTNGNTGEPAFASGSAYHVMDITLTGDGTNTVTDFAVHANFGLQPHLVWEPIANAVWVGTSGNCTDPILNADLGCGLAFGSALLTNVTFTAEGFASAVPVPAAAWLFGSAMLGLVGVGRKRRA